MTNRLLVSGNSTEHYFFGQTSGIMMRYRDKNGLWSESVPIINDAKGPFCVTPDSSGHLIYIDTENRLVYAARKDFAQKKYVLTSLNHEITLKKLEILPISGRFNLLYSAKYDGKYILVHCILGNHAKPQIIDYLSSPDFWICNKKAYYTNSSGNLGYVSLHDEKPDTFYKVCDGGKNVSVYKYGDTEFILYTKDSRLFFNSAELVYDSRMEMPTMTHSAGKFYIMWKSGGYVRYITSQNGGKTWDNPMRFMTNGAAIETFSMQKCGNMYMFYGYNSNHDIHIFSKPDILKPR